MSFLAKALSRFVGIVSLSVWSALAIWHGHIWRKRSLLKDKDIAKAQNDLWSLDKSDSSDRKFQHNFLSLNESVQLHYLSSLGSAKSSRLIVFLHGFPDSCHIFAHFLGSPLADHAKVVSLDLPGFGGSTGLPKYGADEVLNTISGAIMLLKERHLSRGDDGEPGQCILGGHDWGGAVSSRLAMETQGLIDRVVIVNGPVPQLFSLNLQSGFTACWRGLQAWWEHKSNTRALYDARKDIGPVLAQLVKSSYVFMFSLPFFTMRRCRFVMEYLITWCHGAAAKESAASWAAWSWASSIGPSINECTTTVRRPAYGSSVRERAMEHPPGDWDNRLRLYKEGLFTGDWTVRDERIQPVGEPGGTGGKLSFRCPASIVFGLQDPALDYRICVKAVGDFFMPVKGKKDAQSHVIAIEDCGHWSPLEKTGTTVLLEVFLELMTENTNVSVIQARHSTVRRWSFTG